MWEFTKDGRELEVRVEGQLVMSTRSLRLKAALAGLGLAYLMDNCVAEHVAEGRLVAVLTEWSAPFPGFHLYYPSRRQPSAAFAIFVEALRLRGSAPSGS